MMRFELVCILGLLCLVAVSSAPARSIRGHSHSHSYASKLNRCKCFAAKLANYLKLAKVEIKHLTEQNEGLMEEIEELKKTTTTTEATTTTQEPACPFVEPGGFGICGGTFCENDSECTEEPGETLCCLATCGMKLCTKPAT